MEKITIIKHSRKSFYCCDCKSENFILLGANTHINNRLPTLSLILKCEECGRVNVLPVYAVRSFDIK